MYQLILLILLQNVAAQLGDIIPYEVARFSECQALVSTCHPVIASQSHTYFSHLNNF